MVDRASALEGHYNPGHFGREGETGVVLTEIRDLTLHQVAAWPETLAAVGEQAAAAVGADAAPGPCQSASGDHGALLRISFSGEMAYEAYVPSDYAPAMMDLLWAASEPLGGCLYGLEALGALRIEKGHVTGAELDGRVTIDDAGLGKMASPKKSFIGSALRKRPEMMKEGRPQLVGIFPKDRTKKFNAGAILCAENKVSGMGEGWITAVTHSPALGHWIGLGFISGGYNAWEGKTAVAADPVRIGNVEVEIVSPHMYDPSGERMHG